MSAVVKFRLHYLIAQAVATHDSPAAFGGGFRLGWGSLYDDNRISPTFTLLLPRDLQQAMDWLDSLEYIERFLDNLWSVRSCRVRGRLRRCLGLITRPAKMEAGFLEDIKEDPSDVRRWAIYAEWLEEQGNRRGTYILAMLSPFPAEIRSGYPVLMKGVKR